MRECLARAAEELELSASTVLDIPELECSPREVLLERHHGVLEYTDERIRVAARDVTVEIRGMDLRLGAMSQGALHIRGQVAAVEFIRSWGMTDASWADQLCAGLGAGGDAGSGH